MLMNKRSCSYSFILPVFLLIVSTVILSCSKDDHDDEPSTSKIKIIYDSDNTMGLLNHDVDDGLGLFYLLGREDIEIVGITTTFANDTTDVVYENTVRILQEIGYEDIPVLMGGTRDNRDSQAAEFIVSQVNDTAGEIIILAVGSLTNLYSAYTMDNGFYEKVKGLVIMGGLTGPLIFNGKELSVELNFSADPEAAYNVLASKASITVITGNLCQYAFFGQEQFQMLEQSKDTIPLYHYILDDIIPWKNFMLQILGEDGFYLWDVVAAVYITHPEIFSDESEYIVSTVEDFYTGSLKKGTNSESGYTIDMPSSITDIDTFENAIFQSWAKVDYE